MPTSAIKVLDALKKRCEELELEYLRSTTRLRPDMNSVEREQAKQMQIRYETFREAYELARRAAH